MARDPQTIEICISSPSSLSSNAADCLTCLSWMGNLEEKNSVNKCGGVVKLSRLEIYLGWVWTDDPSIVDSTLPPMSQSDWGETHRTKNDSRPKTCLAIFRQSVQTESHGTRTSGRIIPLMKLHLIDIVIWMRRGPGEEYHNGPDDNQLEVTSRSGCMKRSGGVLCYCVPCGAAVPFASPFVVDGSAAQCRLLLLRVIIIILI